MIGKERLHLIKGKFINLYGQSPIVWVQAPGRVDLMGSHTDYNEGFVLTQAIDRNTWIAARPREDNRVIIRSLNLDGGGEFDLEKITYDILSPWSNYIRGVAFMLQQQGFQLQGFEGLIQSSIPFGSGLSSSAALECAAAVLFDTLGNLKIDPVKMALLCQRAENEFVGLNCGILDQYSSLMGQEDSVMLLDCRSITSETKRIAAGIEIVICDTRSKRELTGSEYAERRAQCEEGVRLLSRFLPSIQALRDVDLEQFSRYVVELPDLIARRCRFVIQENQRVFEMAEALSAGDRQLIGGLTADSFEGARDLYEIVSLPMEQMMRAMMNGPGIIGARQAGAGFGGCMVALVEADEVVPFSQHVREDYLIRSGIKPDIYPVKAAVGAGPLKVDELNGKFNPY